MPTIPAIPDLQRRLRASPRYWLQRYGRPAGQAALLIMAFWGQARRASEVPSVDEEAAAVEPGLWPGATRGIPAEPRILVRPAPDSPRRGSRVKVEVLAGPQEATSAHAAPRRGEGLVDAVSSPETAAGKEARPVRPFPERRARASRGKALPQGLGGFTVRRFELHDSFGGFARSAGRPAAGSRTQGQGAAGRMPFGSGSIRPHFRPGSDRTDVAHRFAGRSLEQLDAAFERSGAAGDSRLQDQARRSAADAFESQFLSRGGVAVPLGKDDPTGR